MSIKAVYFFVFLFIFFTWDLKCCFSLKESRKTSSLSKINTHKIADIIEDPQVKAYKKATTDITTKLQKISLCMGGIKSSAYKNKTDMVDDILAVLIAVYNLRDFYENSSCVHPINDRENNASAAFINDSKNNTFVTFINENENYTAIPCIDDQNNIIAAVFVALREKTFSKFVTSKAFLEFVQNIPSSNADQSINKEKLSDLINDLYKLIPMPKILYDSLTRIGVTCEDKNKYMQRLSAQQKWTVDIIDEDED